MHQFAVHRPHFDPPGHTPNWTGRSAISSLLHTHENYIPGSDKCSTVPPPPPHLPSSSASSYTGIPNFAKWHMKKVKTETECKNGSQHSRCIPNAHLTFEYSLKAFFHTIVYS